ncbi:MAG: carboxylesterase family protein, partial [Desulfobacteraceae bacterium]
GASCLQAPNEQGGVSRSSCSHDCLYLNIWTKEVATSGKPVMVWIHGGGYMSGSTANPMYDGEFFVRNLKKGEDCVFVSINYRLSFPGGCDLSVLEGYTDEYADAVNLTKLDQMQALKWINKNIGAWGGDADNITILGQSSGGGAVYHLMADPDANRYFNRAIEQSGAPMFKVIMETKEEARENSKRIFEILGVNTVEELVSLSDAAILDKIKEIHAKIFTGARYADGNICSATWWDDFRNGSAKNIDLLIGSMNGENDGNSLDPDNYPEPVKDHTIIYNRLKQRYKSTPDEYGVLNPFNYDGLIDEYLTLGNDKVLLMQDLGKTLPPHIPPCLLPRHSQCGIKIPIYITGNTRP